MNRLLSTSLLLLAATLMRSACDMKVAAKGNFNLHNDTDANLKILVSDNDTCVIGLHSEVPTHTWRNYDVEDLAKGAILCIDGAPTVVTNGKSYAWNGAELKETAAP